LKGAERTASWVRGRRHDGRLLGSGERVPNSSSVLDDAGGFGLIGGVESGMVLRIALVGKVGGSEVANMLIIGCVEILLRG